LEVEERGVVGDATDFSEEPDESVSPSVSSSVVSMATVGKGCDTEELKRSGCGRDLSPLRETGELPTIREGEGCSSSVDGGVTLRLGEDTTRLALRTEVLFPPRLQEDAESDFEGVES
jgi:hypothetical protein